jgi:hypothetical protein
MPELVIGLIIIGLAAGILGAYLLVVRVLPRPGPLYGKPFRICPGCGETYDDPMDLFHGHIMKMGPRELMTCPKCEGPL